MSIRRNIKPVKPIRDKGEKKLTLKTFMNGVALSAIDAKTRVDEYTIKLRKEVYDKDELMKAMPLNTFTISDLEVELKFMIEEGGEDDIVININPDRLKGESISTLKFKLVSKPLTEYIVDEKKILKE